MQKFWTIFEETLKSIDFSQDGIFQKKMDVLVKLIPMDKVDRNVPITIKTFWTTFEIDNHS